ncbi:MAG TPA: alpha/beta hydrolase [Clostridiales bacterium]|nr:alpha/beta hydrolase [Clostridiales bacterium]
MDKMAIWGENIPGNSHRSKLSDLEIRGNPNVILQTLRFVLALPGQKYRDKKTTVDTFTYVSCIKRGHARETYGDMPYLIPYLAEGSDSAVIVIPGGGYGYISIDTSREEQQTEGALIARRLNEIGISAFVLAYRYNPYTMPIPLLDVQRAVRFVRSKADVWGIKPDNIGLIGFSAGGYQVGGFINLVRGRDFFPPDYRQDATDQVSDQVSNAAMIYPLLTLRFNIPVMFCMFPAQKVRDAAMRNQLVNDYELRDHLASHDVWQFIAQGDKDLLVNVQGVRDYTDALKSAGIPHRYIEAPGANHGFFMNKKYADVFQSYLDWLR